MPFDTVFTTSPPARSAPALSQIAAMTTAQKTVMTLPPTAGPILLATSLAPMFSAIYPADHSRDGNQQRFLAKPGIGTAGIDRHDRQEQDREPNRYDYPAKSVNLRLAEAIPAQIVDVPVLRVLVCFAQISCLPLARPQARLHPSRAESGTKSQNLVTHS